MRYSMFSVHDHYPAEARSVAGHYGETLDHMVLAEELGYESFWLAEHHFHEYGSVPNPAVFLAAASQRTKRIGLGVAVSVTYRLCNMGLSLVGGLFLFLPGARVSRADLRRLEELGPEPSQSRRGV